MAIWQPHFKSYNKSILRARDFIVWEDEEVKGVLVQVIRMHIRKPQGAFSTIELPFMKVHSPNLS